MVPAVAETRAVRGGGVVVAGVGGGGIGARATTGGAPAGNVAAGGPAGATGGVGRGGITGGAGRFGATGRAGTGGNVTVAVWVGSAGFDAVGFRTGRGAGFRADPGACAEPAAFDKASSARRSIVTCACATAGQTIRTPARRRMWRIGTPTLARDSPALNQVS